MNLEALAPIIEEIVKQSLNEKVYYYGRFQKGPGNRVASGTLRNSIKAVVEESRQGIQIIRITALGGKRLEDTYAYWLINDRKGGGPGKFANIGAIENWIMNKKSFKIRDFKTGQFLPKDAKNVRRVAFVIARSIGQFGFQNVPKNFMTVAMDKIMEDPRIMEIVAEATYDELFNKIEGL